MKEHKHTGKLMPEGSFEFMIADGRSTFATRHKHEREKILKHKHLFNRSSGGEDRIAKNFDPILIILKTCYFP